VSAFDLFPAEAATKLESGRAADLNAGAGVLEGVATRAGDRRGGSA
jgi:hypothetical protein